MPLEEELVDHMVTPSLLQSGCAILYSPWQCVRGTISPHPLQHLLLRICDCSQHSQSDMQGPRHGNNPQVGCRELRWRTISCGDALGTVPRKLGYVSHWLPVREALQDP